jgi:transposase
VASTAKEFRPDDERPLKLFFQDEGRFGRIDNLVDCWAPAPVRPDIPQQIIRQYTYVFSAVCPQDGESFSLILPWSDTEAMTIFLDELSKTHPQNRIIIVMDQAAWHKSSELPTFENIKIIFQPPYSPELNPVEHLWKYLRQKYFWNRSWKSLSALESALVLALKKLSMDKLTVRSFSNFNWLPFIN